MYAKARAYCTTVSRMDQMYAKARAYCTTVKVEDDTPRGYLLGFAWSIRPLAWVRFLSAITYTFFAWQLVYAGFQNFSLSHIRYCLMFHHTIAALGLDEGLPLNVAAGQSLFSRLCTPNAVMVPVSWIPSLPKRNHTPFLYVMFVTYAIAALWYRWTDNTTVIVFCSLFLLCSVFDTGLFYSTRPGDILKFLIATLFPQNGMWCCYVMLALLYLFSGLSKCGGWFFSWVFQYQFMAMAPISYHLRHFYLNSDHSPTLPSKIFGFFGALSEAVQGIALLAPFPSIRLAMMILTTGMHCFIFSAGVGPYRWNVMTVYLGWSSFFNLHQQFPLTNPWARLLTWQWDLQYDTILSPPVWCTAHLAFVFVLCVVVPVVGLLNWRVLGKWLGGYRMASFHFAGNELVTFYLIKKEDFVDGGGGGAGAPGMEKEVALAAFAGDGVDVTPIVDKYVDTHTMILLSTVMCDGHAPLLNTKFDESLESITTAYTRHTQRTYTRSQSLLMVQVLPVGYWPCNKSAKPFEIYAYDGLDNLPKLVESGSVELPWCVVPGLVDRGASRKEKSS